VQNQNDAAAMVNACHAWHPANEVQTALIFEEKCKSETFNYLFVIIKEGNWYFSSVLSSLKQAYVITKIILRRC